MLRLKIWKAFMMVSSICLFTNTWFIFKTKNGIKISTEPELIIAAVILRHGDRNPTGRIPTDPNGDISWPEGMAALTRVGVEQLYEVGAFMRRRYASMLGDGRYSDDIVYVQSSNQYRTLRSAAVCLAGLFPNENDRIFEEDLEWQSVPIHTVPKKKDFILFPGRKCSRYERAFDEYVRSPEFIDLMARHKKLFRKLEKWTQKEIGTFRDAKGIYDILWIEKLKNKTLPAWGVKALENKNLKWVVDHTYQIKTNTTLLARLHSGFLIREIVENLQKKIDGSLAPDRSLFLYSASGNTIAKVLNALGLFDPHAPPYASSLHFEVYSLNGEYKMQIVYRTSLDDENPSPMEILSCGTNCTVEKFQSIYRAVLPTGTFEEECL